EEGVAQLLGAEAAGVLAARRLAVGGAGDDETVEFLERPAVADEFAGQPVEQRGVSRARASEAEVVRRGDKALSEVALPDAVHEHADGEGVRGGGNPVGEREAAAGGFL